MKIDLTFSIENKIKEFIINNSKEIKLFFILFLITTIIYGQKLFFYSLATDDYQRFYTGGGEQASILGRWMAGIINQNLFTGALHILPYFNGLLGVFSFTLAGFLTAKYLNRNNVFEVSVITLLITATPFVADNLYYNTNTSAWFTTLFGVAGLMLAYKQSKFLKLLGFSLLVIAIGSYQTIIQVTLSMIVIKTIIDLMEANNFQEIKIIVFNAFLFIGFVLLAFAVSTIINALYIEYNHLTIEYKYRVAKKVASLSVYTDRIETMYKDAYDLDFKLLYFQTKFSFIYALMTVFGTIGGFIFLIKNTTTKKIKILSILLLIILFLTIPLIINLPLITGNRVPARAHYAIGWILAGLFIIQMISFKGVFKTMSSILAISIIIVSTYYINVFFDAASRQTSSDIIRINQIANRILTDKNYISEPLKFRIIGRKSFPVGGWHFGNQALNSGWSKYSSFKKFTDLKYTKMNNKEYNEVADYLIQKGETINTYPGKNSIVVYENKAILFLNLDKEPNKINTAINISKLSDRNPDIASTSILKP